MSKLKEIGNKLFKEEKVELSMEVELNKVDFKKFDKQMDEVFSSFRKEQRKGLGIAKRSADNSLADYIKILDKAESELDEFAKKAEDLGFDFRTSKNWKDFQVLKKKNLSMQSSFSETQKEISKIM